MHPPSFPFARLSAASQKSLADQVVHGIEDFHRTPPTMEELAMLAGGGSNFVVMKELLDLGMSASLVRSLPSPSNPLLKEGVVPLSTLRYGEPGCLPLLELLLERGADPNVVVGSFREKNLASPMHDACMDPVAIRRLCAAGGRVQNVDKGGWMVLDQWLRRAMAFIHTSETLLPSLEQLVQSGWDPAARLQSGRAFLPNCWRHPQLRECLPRMLSLGFDPRQEDAVVQESSASLRAIVQRVVPGEKTYPLAAMVLAHACAMDMRDATPLVRSSSARARI